MPSEGSLPAALAARERGRAARPAWATAGLAGAGLGATVALLVALSLPGSSPPRTTVVVAAPTAAPTPATLPTLVAWPAPTADAVATARVGLEAEARLVARREAAEAARTAVAAEWARWRPTPAPVPVPSPPRGPA